MSSLFENIRSVMRAPGEGRPVCMACGRRLAPHDDQMRLRGGVMVHRACATYGVRRHRSGQARLSNPSR